MFTPAVTTTKSLPKLRFARICVSVSPLIVLVCSVPGPLGLTRAEANAVPTSKVSVEVIGITTKIGVVNSEIVSFTGALI